MTDTEAVAADRAIFSARTEAAYGVSLDTADELEAVVATHLPRDPHYPMAQRVGTTFVRPHDPDDKHKFRIRSYPGSEGDPHFLEIKYKVKQPDGRKLTVKDRMPVSSDVVERLLAGESGASILQPTTLTGADRDLARRAAKVVDKHGSRPIIDEHYMRSAFEAADGSVRITIDRHITATGIGALADAGTVARPGAVFDVKLVGSPPAWVSSLLDTHAGSMSPVEHGKGSTALAELLERAH